MYNRDLIQSVKNFIRNGHEFGYSKVLIMKDCTMMCHSCAKDNAKLILASEIKDYRDSWQPGGVDVYWEGPAIDCCNCNKPITSEYGDPDSTEE